MSRTIFVVLAALIATGTPAYAASMNPDTSVNLLTLYSQSKRQGEEKTEPGGGLSLQEAELQFLADVDPYLKASVLISIESEVETDEATGKTKPPEYGAQPEEAFFESTKLPFVTLKLGKFKAALGRHNALHTHAFPFIDAPLINQRLLGDEGLDDAGVSAAFLVPAPWFLEVTAQAFQGNSEELFASGSSSDVAQVYRLRNLFEFSDAATFDVGISGAAGANSYEKRTKISGADLAFKWRPTQGGKYSALIVGAEYLGGEVQGKEVDGNLQGYAGWVQGQISERWWVQARNEGVTDRDTGNKAKKNTALIAFNPSEFSGFRLQVDRLDEGGEAKPLDSIQLQSNITIGAHPAHSY